ncbi:PREDICTED: integral membrane protein GPR137B-like isoform X2 [Branchiostoma belcheri]|uniref:Integral membrane protein GPR137B-like isoform X2 n=1 Tax=Branchiostoma belcheri TaxID=7741 RepID=A0A6P5AY16_BRABE|nr:PREDICTED: integral membrane protein GPR137B-like isoform X2 [Branchiostoma belcheri]KAI8489262.1 hypothetical protein Bbelb_330010 [Branchiostoma belcheri]
MSDAHRDFPKVFPDHVNGMLARSALGESENVGAGSGDLGAPTPIPVGPSYLPNATFGLTVVYIVLYALLFMFIYAQLWLILYYRHKRLSYQTVFLFLCLFWSGLRTTLFSFYFQNCVLANNLSTFPYWLLYCCPVCLQFITLCLLNMYFAQVVFKAKGKYASNPSRYKRPLKIAFGVAVLIFVATNITCAVLIRRYDGEDIPGAIIVGRVIINDSLFVISAILLSVCIYKIARMPTANVLLEAKGFTVGQSIAASVGIILLYVSRAMYNLVAVSPIPTPSLGYSWLNVSDQADLLNLGASDLNYLVFGLVLFFWELLPTSIVVILYRVRRPPQDLMSSSMSTQSYKYFFDNPRRYDSDDDLSRVHSRSGSQYDIPTLPVTPSSYSINSSTPTPRGYGTIMRSSSGSYPSGQYGMPGTTPPLLFSTGNINPGSRYQVYDGT